MLALDPIEIPLPHFAAIQQRAREREHRRKCHPQIRFIRVAQKVEIHIVVKVEVARLL